jgi:hypothetical protein
MWSKNQIHNECDYMKVIRRPRESGANGGSQEDEIQAGHVRGIEKIAKKLVIAKPISCE